MAPVLELALITSASILVATLLLWRWRTRGKRLPPGPWGVPLLGSLPFLGPQLHHSFASIAQTYGPVASLRLGTKLCVLITSPSAAKEVLKDNDAVFASHDPPIAAYVSSYGGTNVLWAPQGAYWRMVRKLVVREMVGAPNLEAFQPLRDREVQRLIQELRSKEGEEVEMRGMFFHTLLNEILGMVLGRELAEDSSLGIEFRQVIDSIMDLWGTPNISDFIPALAPLDLQGLQRRGKKLSLRLDAIFDSIREERAGTKKAGEGEKSRDFFQVLLDLIETNDPQNTLSFDNAKALILDMINAGTDTTVATLEWAMSELMRRPEMMARVREELDTVVGSGRAVEESDIPKLHYLGAVLKETMRLHTVAPLLVPYKPSSDCNVGGYTIPKGSKVFVNVWAIHRDPCSWDDPLEFKPERFLTESNKREYYGKSFDFIPFGSGRRICAGIGLGERMGMYILSSLLHSFEWQLPIGVTSVDVDEKFGLVMKKEKPLVLVPVWRLGHC